jgi:hypothetical protein
MKKFQAVFLEDLEVPIPCFAIRRFAPHRHSRKSNQIEQRLLKSLGIAAFRTPTTLPAGSGKKQDSPQRNRGLV